MNENETGCYKQLVQKSQIKNGVTCLQSWSKYFGTLQCLSQIRLTTNKTKRGIQYAKLGIRVA